jgi:arylsulfatase A-like enzyme
LETEGNDRARTGVVSPSRTSLLTGKRPSSTGVYSNQQDWTKAPKAKDVVTLPEYFGKHGYRSVSTGKIFHGSSGNAFQERGDLGGFNGETLWKESPAAALGKSGAKNELLWGACKAPLEKTRDYVACMWAVDQLTLVELCGLPPNTENEGRSFAPLLRNPKMEWSHPTLTTYLFRNHSLTDGRHRYTWYGGRAAGAEELYDHSTDPREHKNLAANPESKEIIARFKKFLPTHDEPNSPRSMAADVGKKGKPKETDNE